MKRRFVALLLLGLAACTPWYREDLLRGERATDPSFVNERLAAASRDMDQNRPAAAAAKMQQAVEAAPDCDASIYLAWAYALAGAGRHEQARAVGRYALDHGASDAKPFLVREYAAAGLDSVAFQLLDPLNPFTASTDPALHEELADLAAADSLSSAGKTHEALEHYAAWLATWGVPDQPKLRDWSSRIVARLGKEAAGYGPAAEERYAAGDIGGALTFYGAAWRFRTPADFAIEAPHFADAAARAPDIATASPLAAANAAAGYDAAKAGRLGEAIRDYRRAVAAAPWWTDARTNLARLLSQAGLDASSVPRLVVASAAAPAAPAAPAPAAILPTLAAYRAPPYPRSGESDPLDQRHGKAEGGETLPSSAIDALACDALIQTWKMLDLDVADAKDADFAAALEVYVAHDWNEMAGWRPWFHWNFVRSLSSDQRKALAAELAAYARDTGVKGDWKRR